MRPDGNRGRMLNRIQDPGTGYPVLPTGALLPNGWRVDKLLGAGAFGSVYGVTAYGKPLALKEFRPHPQLPPDALLERVEMEAQILKLFTGHPCLPAFAGRFDIDGCHFLAQEYIAGLPLSKVLGRGPGIFTLAEALAWLIIVTRTLDHLHRKLLLYQDLKPANIMIRPSRTPVLIDFGAARHYAGVKANPRLLFGSLGYVAPEILQDPTRQRDYRSDVYSVGCLAYTLFTGRMLHQEQILGQRRIVTPSKLLKEFHAEANNLPENWHEALNSLLLQTLEPDPLDREGDLEWFSRHLQGLALRAGGRERFDTIIRMVQDGMNAQDRALTLADEEMPELDPANIISEPQVLVFARLTLADQFVVKPIAFWSSTGKPVHATVMVKGPGLEAVEKNVRGMTGRVRVKASARQIGNLNHWSQGVLALKLPGGQQKRVPIRLFVAGPGSEYLDRQTPLPPFLMKEP